MSISLTPTLDTKHALWVVMSGSNPRHGKVHSCCSFSEDISSKAAHCTLQCTLYFINIINVTYTEVFFTGKKNGKLTGKKTGKK